MNKVYNSKQELREAILDLIITQKEEEASYRDQVILNKFLALPVLQQAKTILLYASIKGEVNTLTMIERVLALQKRVALPLVRKTEKKIIPVEITTLKELRPGTYNILEPQDRVEAYMSPQAIDLAVVPAVAFDRQHNRLGRGAGYYDRFLAELPLSTPTVGLAYDFQVVDSIPGLEAHDRPVQQLLTN